MFGGYLLCFKTSTKKYLQRTEKNVQDADGTVIFTVLPKLSGRSKKTADFAEAYHKPWILTYCSSDRGDRVFVADGCGEGVADSRNDAGSAVGRRAR